MRSFSTFSLPSLLETSRHDFVHDFFVPLLSNATRYDRGVGYFSSGWIRLNAAGLHDFAANGGYARIIASPILSEEDWQALVKGVQAQQSTLLREALSRDVAELIQSLETKTLTALAWMVADRLLEFRIAVPANELSGEFHAKFGVFTDAHGNQVSFEGSYNDSIQGTRNYESLKVFRSWLPFQQEMVHSDNERFERLWCNEDPNVRVYALPEAIRDQLLQLRSGSRPYTAPRLAQPNHPQRPASIELRDYQEEAIQAWFRNECRGIFEMATGTGKTITALAAATRLYGRERRLALVITVPYQHLVDQWSSQVKDFGWQPILAYQRKKDWLDKLSQQVSAFKHQDRDHMAVITTHTTFADNDFQAVIAKLTAPSLLVADEMHHLGAERRRLALPEHLPARLGLSATPDRWFDDVGTQVIRDYFGDTVFAYPLEQAIGTVLTPYFYYPQLVELTPDEFEEYQDLSTKIARLIGSSDAELQDALEMLLIKRARLLNSAENKLVRLGELLDKMPRLEYALFYCSPEQIEKVSHLVGWQKGLIISRFTAQETNKERQQILADFASGQFQGLVAMKCLDEGVDVPDTRVAFILASSSNPREFIQRRGRILRRSPGKTDAAIYDFIPLPPTQQGRATSFTTEQSIVRHELARFAEFANSAKNKHTALEVIWDVAKQYQISLGEV